jgi:uncharacterized protein YukE
MKLNISAKELLALHNMLFERYAYPQACDARKYEEDNPHNQGSDRGAADEVQLRQVYNRLRACIVGSLSGKAVDAFEAWQANEQTKIDQLNNELDNVKQDQTHLARTLMPEDIAEGDDFSTLEYPRRGTTRGRQGSNNRNKR